MDCIDHLSNKESIAIDLEFDKNRFRFGFNLCLMQLATDEQCFLLDPLVKDVDIELVFPLLENDQITKLAFEFGEDMRLLHVLGCNLTNLEDLSFASKLLNNPQLSLVNLIMKELNAETSKSSQSSNWFIRPLTEKQCLYAAEDVVYLHQLKNALMKKLEGDDRMDWYLAENNFFEQQNFEVNGAHELSLSRDERDQVSQVDYHVLKKLHAFRLKEAKLRNRPEYQILHGAYMFKLVTGECTLDNFEKEAGTMRVLRNSGFKQRLHKCMKEARSEAHDLGLSKKINAFEQPSPQEKSTMRQAQKLIDKEVEAIWKPIQLKIKERWGENVATFLLSNRIMKELADGNRSFIPDYRLNLFDELSEHTNVK